jgi:formate hydrogenlyase transcriptional activator
MNLHPGPEKRRVPDVKPAEFEPIRRALHENEDWYQDLVEHSQDLLCIHDLEGRLLSVNPAPARVLGYSVEELLQIPMQELVAPEFRAQFDAYLSQIVSVGESRGLLAVMTRSGERRIWEYHNTLRTEGVASPIVRGMAHDVTEQKRAEKLAREASEDLLHKVHESERTIRELKLFRTLVDQSNDAIEVVDPETLRFLDVNEKACTELGYSREELLSMGVFDIDPTVTEASAGKAIEALRKLGFVVREGLHRRKDGSTFPVEISAREVHLERDYVVTIVHNLSERKRAEARLEASESRYRAVHDRAPVGICRIETATGRFLGVTLKSCEILGRTEQDLLGRNFQSITYSDDLVENLEKLRQLAQGEVRHYEMEKRFLRPDGSVRWVEIAIVAMWPEGDSPDWHMAILQDITERRQAEKSQREYERVVEGLEEAIAVVDRDYRYVIANRAFLKLRGMEKEQVVGRLVSEVINGEDFQTVFKPKLDECFQGKVVRYQMTYKYPKAGERDIFASYFPIEGVTGIDRIAAVVQDITERKRADEALKKSEEKFSKAFRQSPLALTLTSTRDHRYIEVNETFERATGWRRDEVIGRTPFDIGLWVHPGERLEFGKRLLTEGSLRSLEVSFRMRDGRIRICLITAEMIELNGELCALGVAADVTERRQAEEALRHTEESYRNFVSQSSEGIFREDLDTPILIGLPEDELIHHLLYNTYLAECNDAMAAMYGLTSGQELRGKRLAELLPPEDPRNIELARQFVRAGFCLLEHESHEVDRYGNPKVFLNSLIGTVENGMLVHTWGIQRDITEKVKLEESRRQAEEALRQHVLQLQEVTEELRVAKEKLSEEKLYLEEAIDAELGFGEIIGRSSAMKQVMEKVAKVAPNEATVLLLGETGTGKELVARALHRMSHREGNSFIKLNCAAIPSGLLESELFGHEKGAFTGAVARKLGRLELADRGTLFLDEVGEISLSLQPKLLRVLQDQEFERLGGTQTLKVNFRLLAATNRDLLQSVKSREFRSDLYYRLNVFPILIPPLRERREDVRPLIEHFVRKFANQMKRSITSIPSRTMEMLVRWDWPGNIRELENFVERSVILTPGSVLQAPLSELQTAVDDGQGGKKDILRDKERERILRALRECHGKLGGPDGAAARLGLKRTTLQSKLDHLGIKPGGYRG